MLIVFVIVSSLWTTILTVMLFRMITHYNQLAGKNTSIGLKEILDTILGNQSGLKAQVAKLEDIARKTNTEGRLHIQRMGIVRFNPFSDTGGSQSFTLALLDGQDNGIVMTSLYARTGNRWYVKEIREGKGKELELSKEEQAAIKKAHESHE